MNELIERVSREAGISAEQAGLAINAVKEFVKEKFPMVAGAVDQILGGSGSAAVNDADITE
jgi:hypothetical protein